MEFKLRTSAKITARVHCPAGKTPFPVTPDRSSELLSARCPQCGATVTIPSRGIFNEADRTVDAGGARVGAGVISATGLAVTFWAAFWPEPYRMAVLACALVPLAVVAVRVSGRRLKLIDNPRRSRTANVTRSGGPYSRSGLFDSSRPVRYAVKVTGQRVLKGSRGGRTSYLKVAPWGSQVEDNEVSVSRRMYEQTKVNDTVHIGVRSGYFNIPWYYVRP
jgi:hypothetical protein